ncbi:hypothetical protein B0T26DRAFT_741387 [Lasiosphaeria miniovina]|uniref:Prolyl 4-hydroxylase alpha subunit domain-containing protein n=1 Tax=Lasiosphaeria miniovina TaxID=1954250 RepID=A0AA40AM61_9PEZI|nr:uncharacterized protein B0T26DRAFT_741387 [Lasiosphaeria miniovina]KAK0718393.1 hypothetical protein B0T26DRAFT_741387 [Lasiosphaeria miniovina]
MFSYIVAFLGLLVVFYNPIAEFLTPGVPQIRRIPRPRLNEDLLALETAGAINGTGQQCPPNAYSIHIYSRAPLVIYVENFLSADERSHLLEISEPIFEPSTVTHDDGATTERAPTVRDSEVALIPRTDAVRCIEARSRALQGWPDEVWTERLRVQRYRPGGHYNHHFDWNPSRGGWGRVSSFMAWVGDGGGSLEGGGTEFPRLRPPVDPRWCAFVECPGPDPADDESAGTQQQQTLGAKLGVVFKPVAGNAVYWENFRPDGTGRGYDESWHAGLPVVKGVKVGLNIWSWGKIE